MLHGSAFRSEMRPELILQLGRCPTSGAWKRYVEEHLGCEHWVIAPFGWHDDRNSAARLLFAEIGPTLELLAAKLAEDDAAREESAWAAELRRSEELARREIDRELAADGGLSEGAVARSVASCLPATHSCARNPPLPALRRGEAATKGRERRQ